MTINVTYHGINSSFFPQAFSDINGDFNPVVVSQSRTSLVIEGTDGAIVTTFTGRGFTFSGDTPTGGRITGVTFEDGAANTIATFTGMTWQLADFFSGMENWLNGASVNPFDGSSTLWDVMAGDSYVIDASDADTGYYLPQIGRLTDPVGFTGSDTFDVMIGSSARDSLSGGRGDDGLYAGKGNDRLNGGGGQDTLWAGKGKDKTTGGAGDDAFLFDGRRNENKNTIRDFTDGEDTLWISRGAFADLTITQVRANTKIVTDNGTKIILKNFDATDLTEGDFRFINANSAFNILDDFMA